MASVPAIFNRYKTSVGRVLDITGPKPLLRGTCFLVSSNFAVTCHHVVHTSKGQIQQLEVRLEGQLRQPIPVTVYLTDEDMDISLLELGGDTKLTPFPVSSHDAWGEAFYTFGYPLQHGGAGVSQDGEIFGPSSTINGAARLELRANRILQGFSGGPVFVMASETVGYSIGCISDTGSTDYPDRPACTPLSSFLEQYPDAARSFSTMREAATGNLESTLLEVSGETSDASLWKFTRQLVKEEELKSHPSLLESQSLSPDVDIPTVANRVYETVRQTLATAKHTDEARVRQLTVIVNGLRTKYAQLGIELRSLYIAARELQRSTALVEASSLSPPLLSAAEIVSDDLERIPTELLSFAKTHGARMHYTVLTGHSFGWVNNLKSAAPTWRFPETRSGLGYVYENIARLFEAANSLLEFDLSTLSKGYLDSGWVTTENISGLSRLLFVSQRGNEPTVSVYSERTAAELKQIARLVARRQPIGELSVQRRKEGISIFAAGAQYLYRWDLSAPTPVTEFNINDALTDSLNQDDSDTINVVRVEPEIDGGVFICTHANRVFHLSGGKLQNVSYQKGHVGWKNPEGEGFYTAAIDQSVDPHHVYSVVVRKIVGKKLVQTSIASATTLTEMLADVITLDDLRAGSPQKSQPNPRLKQVRFELSGSSFFDLTVDELRGSRCLVLLAGIGVVNMASVVGSIVLFLDPYTLKPIHRPVLTTLSIMDLKIVRWQDSSLLVATLTWGTPEFNPKIAVWDLSDKSGQAPSILGAWHEDGYDARNLNIVTSDNGFDVYYLLTQHYSETAQKMEEIWKFKWPERKGEKLLKTPSGAVTSMTVWNC